MYFILTTCLTQLPRSFDRRCCLIQLTTPFKMRFSTITTVLLPSIALAAPAALQVRAEPCAPTLYTLSDFTLETSSSHGAVNFSFKSTFADGASIDDSVINGSTCHGEGASVPNNNVCSAPDRKLLFDLRAEQNAARYQITHTWVCNG